MEMIIDIPIDTYYHIKKNHQIDNLSSADKYILIETISKAIPFEKYKIINLDTTKGEL